MPRDDESTPFQTVLQLLVDEGFDGFATALEILVNEAMKLERAAVLQAAPYERTPERRGHANGFKPKTVVSRLGKLQLAVPQTRGVEFYPSALERGERSERALKLALAEMYVQGVSTRRVAAITQELCGTEVTSMQVSRAAMLLDEVLLDRLHFNQTQVQLTFFGELQQCGVVHVCAACPRLCCCRVPPSLLLRHSAVRVGTFEHGPARPAPSGSPPLGGSETARVTRRRQRRRALLRRTEGVLRRNGLVERDSAP